MKNIFKSKSSIKNTENAENTNDVYQEEIYDSKYIYDRKSPPSATVFFHLRNALSFGDFLKKSKKILIDQNLSHHLMLLLKQKNLKRSDVVRDSGIDLSYVCQIFSGEKNPFRDKLIAISFGMHLNEEEIQRMLKIAGHSELYPRISRDALILFAIQHGMDVYQTDIELDKYNFSTLLSE